jgi:hypothetical protein
MSNSTMGASLKQLEALHRVFKLGRFQTTAARLHTTQSAVRNVLPSLNRPQVSRCSIALAAVRSRHPKGGG